ncbi:MAG TPA: allantoin permease, partial [Amnibacterium sp.]|nr:allantoin permease [Amnibacterium sp.]
MSAQTSRPAAPGDVPRAGIELNGLNTIAEAERHGRARDLFWPWFAANVSVLGLGYGSFILG